jgi:uncharacterized protein
MSERDGFQPGVPCWVDTIRADLGPAVAFYTGLFGWEVDDPMPDHAPGGRYVAFTLRGRRVAGAGSPPPGTPAPERPRWNTYVWVESAEDAVAAAVAAGGSVALEPFDADGAGRGAFLADPEGALFGVWQPGAMRGAQLVNQAGAWSFTSLWSAEPERAQAFYSALFGWESEGFAPAGGGFVLWRRPGYVGGEPSQPVPRDVVAGLVPVGEGPLPWPPGWRIDFWVDDVDAAAERAVALGGAVLDPPTAAAVGRSAVLADPEGASFSVSRVVP